MERAVPFTEWDNFYVIVGSSAAALTGLQFVVIALIADLRSRSSTREIDAFATPTIMHFGAVLLFSGILTAPWHELAKPAALLALCGVSGLVYSLRVRRRARRQTSYQLVFEDWLFHVLLPMAAYALLAGAAVALRFSPHRSLFVIAASAMLLLFIGIHNAWDTVTYLVVVKGPEEKDDAAKAADAVERT
jgi:hypothetical protein